MKTQDAKLIPIGDLLAALGHVPVKEVSGERWYLSPFRDEATASFKLSADQRAWYDHGLGRGGNILDLAMLLFNVSLVEALREIERLAGAPTQRAAARGQYSLLERDWQGAVSPPSEMPLPSPKASADRAGAFQEVSFKAVTDARLLRYLRERAIPPSLARDYLQEIHYTYHEKRYFALAFPNDAGSFEMRNQYYQGVYGKKAISTLRASALYVPSVAVFEGVFDFLSALVWDPSALDGTIIVMNSVAMKAQTLAALGRMETPTVKLFLDNDKAGQTLAAELRQALTGVNVVDCSAVYAGYKDFNAFLQKQRHVKPSQGNMLA